MTKQAPLPWTLTQNSWQYTTIYDAEGKPICRLDLEDWSVTEDNQDALEAVQTQIARRIVDAVNADPMRLDWFDNAVSQKLRADRAEARLEEAKGLIHSLLGLELGSSEKAMAFLDTTLADSPADRGSNNG